MSFDPAGFAVRRWQFTLVAFALLTVLGLNAFSSIPRSEDPHFPIPIMIVRAVLPGAEPTEMEQLIADPLEDALDGLDDVGEIRSTSQDGSAVVQVEFDWSVDTDRKYDEVVREVNALRPTLPDGIALLEVRRARTTVFDAVITDYMMPEMNGLELLQELRDLQPDTIRIVLTGVIDIETVMSLSLIHI